MPGSGLQRRDEERVRRGVRTLDDRIGTLLREFSYGHARQLEAVLREHLVTLCGVDLLPGAQVRTFLDMTRCCARSTGTPRGATQGPLAVGDHDQHRPRGAGNRWDAASRGQDRLGQGCLAGWFRYPTRGRPVLTRVDEELRAVRTLDSRPSIYYS